MSTLDRAVRIIQDGETTISLTPRTMITAMLADSECRAWLDEPVSVAREANTAERRLNNFTVRTSDVLFAALLRGDT